MGHTTVTMPSLFLSCLLIGQYMYDNNSNNSCYAVYIHCKHVWVSWALPLTALLLLFFLDCQKKKKKPSHLRLRSHTWPLEWMCFLSLTGSPWLWIRLVQWCAGGWIEGLRSEARRCSYTCYCHGDGTCTTHSEGWCLIRPAIVTVSLQPKQTAVAWQCVAGCSMPLSAILYSLTESW